jgi:uncharacterized protein YoxC
MQEMIVKNVDVMGDFITAAKDHDGNVWVGVRWVCDALDMTEGQMKRQIKNIKKDMLFGEGGSNQIPLPTAQGTQDVFCIRNDFIPLWLAKINITEKTREERPEFSKKLLKYQLKAKDILAAAFLPKQDVPPLTLQQQIQTIAKGTDELYQRVNAVTADVTAVKGEIQALKDDMPVFQADAKDIQSDLRKKAVEALGGYKSPAYNDKSTRSYVFSDIQRELRRQFAVKRYDQIKHKDVPTALEIIAQYTLPLALKNRVDMANAQQTLNLEGGAC